MIKEFNFPSINTASLSLILGLGQTGIAAANWIAANGGKLRLLDTRSGYDIADKVNANAKIVNSEMGPSALTNVGNLDEVDSIILSPGLNPNDHGLASFIAAAKKKNIEVIGEIELFARALLDLSKQDYKPLVFAVTGTNGKTTVTALLGHLLKAAGLGVRVAGNIGPAALDSLLEAVNNDDLPQAWVLELSSFQLYTTSTLQADAAVVLNISQDHLDWHGSMANYIAAKTKLLRMSKTAVVNRNDATVASMVNAMGDANVRSFGLDSPELVGDFGVKQHGNISWLAYVHDAIRQDAARQDFTSKRDTGQLQSLIPVNALHLLGQHNTLNALAALCLANAANVAVEPMLHELRAYKGEPHRTEFVRTVAGVDFINDSKGTNVGATIAALNGIERPIVLIAGGLGKNQDFSLLAKVAAKHAKSVCLIGKDANLIAEALRSTGVSVEFASDMEQAVMQAFKLASPGDVVLLSPACASMDMFANYIDRGKSFVAAIREVALDQGELA